MTSCAPARHRYLLRKRNIDTSSIDLPDEIIELVLSRCPVKSVVRFKSVSKSWLSIISHPGFSEIHRIQRSALPENQNKFLMQNKAGDCVYLIRLEDGKFQTESALEYPFKTKRCSWLRLLSSCNGLFLVFRAGVDKKDEYALWNPSIGKHIILTAHPHASQSTSTFPWHYDIYHDSVTEDYKIVFVCKEFYSVYSCKNGSWSEMRDLPRHRMHQGHPAAHADGCFYWGVCNGEMVCFDVRDGGQHKLQLPKDVGGGLFEVRSVSGHVCLVELNQNSRKIQLWVMEKHKSFRDKWCFSWRKIISMEKEDPNISFFYHPLCLSNEDHIVFKIIFQDGQSWYSVRPKHGLYNPHQNCFHKIEFAREKLEEEYFPFSENLYMPSSISNSNV